MLFRSVVTAHLGVAQQVIDSEQLNYDPNWRLRPAAHAEPSWAATEPAARGADRQAMAQQAAVWLYGEGPDNALTFEWRVYLRWLVGNRRWWQLLRALISYAATKSIKEWDTTMGRWLGRPQVTWPEPDVSYIRPAPGNEVAPQAATPAVLTWRPRALNSFRGAQWPFMLETLDTEYASTAIDWRHPFLDLRVLEFMLATPPIPWGRRKRLIRRAMRGRLPQEILERDKTPLHHDLLADQLRASPPVMPTKGSRIEEFVDLERLPADLAGFCDPYALLRVSILDHWLNTRGG